MDTVVVIAVAAVGTVVGAVGGYLFKHIQDTEMFNDLCRDVVDQAKELDLQEIEIRELKKEVNRMNELAAVKAVKGNKAVRVSAEDFPEFFDVNNLPTYFDKDVDFGGNF